MTLHHRNSALHVISFPKEKTVAWEAKNEVKDRFELTASKQAQVERPCILTIRGKQYNMTAWAKAHPGGVAILQKFHNKDATKAFEAVGHSQHAQDMLRDFEIPSPPSAEPSKASDSLIEDAFSTQMEKKDNKRNATAATTATTPEERLLPTKNNRPRWVNKLFTKEDPIGVHKYAGIFVLGHYLYRYVQMYFFDKAAGFGSRGGAGASWTAPICLIPHVMLSLSSLIFHTVPKERVVGKPMIWKEYRIHNIVFAMRSVISTFLAWLSIYKNHAPFYRRLALVGCGVAVLTAQYAADEATRRLRSNSMESTTATMPYWDGCTIETQKRFKSFYAYCQFLATFACFWVGNPAFGLAVMLPIQLASLLMTLVRKGILSAKGYHIWYTLSLCMPFGVGVRSLGPTFFLVGGLGWTMYQLRRRGFNKYVIWTPLVAARFLVGDQFINYARW